MGNISSTMGNISSTMGNISSTMGIIIYTGYRPVTVKISDVIVTGLVPS